ncbi:MAG: hypothetical protein HZB43_01355 [candidate division Zixibacteria bacterium]|nr:hypothetical protein [candidate division Zixibacteria bacterium]
MATTQQKTQYQYFFKRHIDIADVQDTLTLAILGAENLHGRARIRLDGSWRLDRQRRVCTIDASTPVGEDIAKLFTGYLGKEFGEAAFSVRRPAGSAATEQKCPPHSSRKGVHHR